MAHKGHTGVEGQLPMVLGIVVAFVGLIWVALAFLIQEAGSAVVLPGLLLLAGVITFLVGRSMAKANAGSRE